jgi:hypothetical protein
MVATCSMRGMKRNGHGIVVVEPIGIIPLEYMDETVRIILRNILKE